MKVFKKTLLLVLMLLMSFSLLGSSVSAASKTHLSKTKVILTVGEAYTLKLYDKNDKAISATKIIWKTADKKIVRVSDKGKIRGVSVGTTKITAQYGKNTYTCTVTVKKATFKVAKKTLTVGSSFTQILKDANGKKIDASKIVWSSADKSIASVSSKGKVTAKKAGTVKISAKYLGTTYKFTVTVMKPKVVLKNSAVELWTGESKTLSVKSVYPEGVTVKWKSRDTSVAKVSSTGKVTAVDTGETEIVAYFKYKDKIYKDTCVIEVYEPEISVSQSSAVIYTYETLELYALTNPEDVEVKWKSRDTSVAKVSPDGVVTPIDEGTVKITASFTYNSKTYIDTCTVTVKQFPAISVKDVDWSFNSVDGVDLSLTITNNTYKDIKYIKLYTEYKNRFGDPAYCEVWDTYSKILTYSNGVMVGETVGLTCDAVIYNGNVHRIDIVSAEVTFVDNTTATVDIGKYWYDSYYYYQ